MIDIYSGYRVEVVSNCKSKGKTGVVRNTNGVNEVTIVFDIPNENGKTVQTFNRSSLELTNRIEKAVNTSTKVKNSTKVAVVLRDGCEYELYYGKSLDDVLQQVQDDSDGDPDMAPDYIVWEGVKYEIETSLKFTIRT